ncbi:uncharacterized protein BP5553_02573 [Venustampulla echinocandica]|uniref:DUF7892 domain-containing protein n=1 Tax=Venustampulla echinocandica TaxID=2656787 RepID=A0A370TRU9_9HELO|nr:uncharacterized protein BP5553_02573 [Venustampulla echinocandica]RDL38233.1 hypothetical protein BP5553_02573 [Venustampulla echinocandica]
MEATSSGASSGDTESTPADPTPIDASPVRDPRGTISKQPSSERETTTLIDNDDSASDVSMSADSDDEDDGDDEGTNASASHTIPSATNLARSTSATVTPPTDASRKRKHSGSAQDTPNGQLEHEFLHEVRKRVKPDLELEPYRTPEGRLCQDKSLLPAELWHHIFTFCHPRVLGRLLQVNKTFHAYIDPSGTSSIVPLSKSALQILQPDAIWRASRLRFRHGMPGPVIGKSELDMWRMACDTFCQFCHKRQAISPAPMDPWHPGPGQNGVVCVWPFGIRTCGSCLEAKSTKEIDLLLSSSIPSLLMPALPFVFLTNELHVIPPAVLQNGQQPSTVQITKRFLNSHIDEIKKDFDEAKALGAAPAEEWLKGLENRGRERRTDAARWERYESLGGVATMSNVGNPETPYTENGRLPSPAVHAVKKELAVKAEHVATADTIPMFPSQGVNSGQQTRQYPFQGPPPSQPINTSFQALATNTPARFDSPSQNRFGSYPPPRAHQQPRHERTKEEVAQLKAARRLEIERRCMLLDPPLTPGVLAHIPSFQAAIQIIQPLNDGAWEVLKPRLLSQRGEAEQRENERLAQTRAAQDRFDERRQQDSQVRVVETLDSVDKEWDDIQAPLRARIGGYADEIIRDGWSGGDKVNYENCPKFAADVLIYVRKRFYAEVAKDEAAIRATGQEPAMDPPNGPCLRKLILENMKWVFDTKIKPHTEQHRKELFLCNACETNPKYYGFEGVIQHYAAKHTNALSVGSVVVHWKSEWPEYPPFNPDPASVAHPPYYSVAPGASAPYPSNPPPLQQNFGYGGYHPAPVSAPMAAPIPAPMQGPPQGPIQAHMQVPNPQSYQQSPGPYYGHPQFGEPYSGHQNGPYAPPQAYQDTSHSYQAPQYSVAPPPPNVGFHEGPQDYTHQGFGGQYPPPNQGMYTSPSQGQLYPISAAENPGQQQGYNPPQNHYDPAYNQPASYPSNGAVPGPQVTEEYKAQLNDVAKNAREVWNTINPIKEIPGSVKVYTVIYHILQRFRDTYQDDPPLSMIIDGLSNNKEMRPVRNINGLLCKACTQGMAGSRSVPQKKHFSFPQLVSHFHTVHEEGIPKNSVGRPPDWKTDMVELPDLSKLTSLVTGSRKDDRRLKLITEAIPEIISPPKPVFEELRDIPRNEYGAMDNGSYAELAPSQDNHDKYYTAGNRDKPLEAGGSPYANEEYDPRNPRDIPIEPRPLFKPAHQNGYPREANPDDAPPRYRFARREESRADLPHQVHSDRPYLNQRPVSPPSQARISGDYDRVVIPDDRYMDRRARYREPVDVQYRIRHDPSTLPSDNQEPLRSGRDYRMQNLESYEANRRDIPVRDNRVRDGHVQPLEDASAQQNRIFAVVEQISRQAQRARDVKPQEEPAEAGSEDGELRAGPVAQSEKRQSGPADEASDAAERFLNNFLAGDTPRDTAIKTERREVDDVGAKREPDRGDSERVYQPKDETRHLRDDYEDSIIPSRRVRPAEPVVGDAPGNGYIVHERPSQGQPRAYAYEDRYVGSAPEHTVQRERSPELVDRRYKLNNVVYRDERQTSTHRTPSRYARYESVRLENDRVRSRSPVYVKMGSQPGPYRERSPAAHPLHPEPVYRTRTPQPVADEIAYERPPRQEYYRVYADEPRAREPPYAEAYETRAREPPYAEAYELVRVADSQGEYVIRRPVRREPEPIYATYEDDGYSRQPVYESRAPAPRAESVLYEEYDPRHPAPPPIAPVRQASRYQ